MLQKPVFLPNLQFLAAYPRLRKFLLILQYGVVRGVAAGCLYTGLFALFRVVSRAIRYLLRCLPLDIAKLKVLVSGVYPAYLRRTPVARAKDLAKVARSTPRHPPLGDHSAAETDPLAEGFISTPSSPSEHPTFVQQLVDSTTGMCVLVVVYRLLLELFQALSPQNQLVKNILPAVAGGLAGLTAYGPRTRSVPTTKFLYDLVKYFAECFVALVVSQFFHARPHSTYSIPILRTTLAFVLLGLTFMTYEINEGCDPGFKRLMDSIYGN